jgi:probable LLM family oxidoreductase
MQIGLDSFVETTPDPATGALISPAERVRDLLEEMELADQVGLDVFGIGEHHRKEFVASAPAVILAAGAARTKRIRLSSAVTVLSSSDPVRVFQDFATLDLISQGRAEIIVGRGSFVESFPLFGYDLDDYDDLFVEKLDLLLRIRDNVNVEWSGKHRAALHGEAVYPRPLQNPLPIMLGVGGTIIGGEPHRFRPLVDMYREAGRRAGQSPDRLTVSIHSHGFLADTEKQAASDLYPSWAQTFTRIGKERGWPPATRAQFDAACGPTGAMLLGDPEAVAEKLLYENEALGGINRVAIMLTAGTLPHNKVMRAIELLGTKVAPLVRNAHFSRTTAPNAPTPGISTPVPSGVS